MLRVAANCLRTRIFTRSMYSGFTMDPMNVSYQDIQKIMKSGNCVLLDVREANELAEDGKIPITVHVPLAEVAKFADKVKCDKSDSIIVHCKTGMRATKAIEKLQSMGYEKVYVFPGGVPEWTANQ